MLQPVERSQRRSSPGRLAGAVECTGAMPVLSGVVLGVSAAWALVGAGSASWRVTASHWAFHASSPAWALFVALPSGKLLHHDPVALNFVQTKPDCCSCFGRRHVMRLDLAEDFTLVTQQDDAPAPLHAAGELGGGVLPRGMPPFSGPPAIDLCGGPALRPFFGSPERA